MHLNQISEKIIQSAIAVHKHFGPGLFEQVYTVSMELELKRIGLRVEREVPLVAEYLGVRIEPAYRVDLLVEGCVIVEVKSIKALQDVHRKQLPTYLKLADQSLGLLLNFNSARLIDGIARVVRGVSD